MKLILVVFAAMALLLGACKDKAEEKPKPEPKAVQEKTIGSEGQKIKMIAKSKEVGKEVESVIQTGVDRNKRLMEQK